MAVINAVKGEALCKQYGEVTALCSELQVLFKLNIQYGLLVKLCAKLFLTFRGFVMMVRSPPLHRERV